MKNIGRRLFLISFIFAILSAVGVYLYLLSLDDTPKVVEEVKITILVAAVDIEPRTIIEKEMLKEIEMPEGSDYGSFINDSEEVVGLYAKEKIYTDERIHSNMLIEDTNSELSLKITGDRRAISLQLTQESGVANLIKSGDYVDVFVALPELQVDQVVVRPNISKLILQNVEILAINQMLDRERPILDEQLGSFTVTLSVPILDIEGLVLAENLGTLKLALRPVGRDYIYKTEGMIWEELFVDDFDKLKDMFPVFEVNSRGVVIIDEEEYSYDKYYYYTIQYGDTLKTISKEFYGSEDHYSLLKEINRIDDEDTIFTGSNIIVPVLDLEGENIKEGEADEQN